MNIDAIGVSAFAGAGTPGAKNRYRIYDASPEEVLSGHDLSDVSKKDYGKIERELFLNQNEDSRSIGKAFVMGQMMENPCVPETGGQNLFDFSGSGNVDLLGSILEKYKQQISLGGSGAGDLLKLYQCLSEINRN